MVTHVPLTLAVEALVLVIKRWNEYLVYIVNGKKVPLTVRGRVCNRAGSEHDLYFENTILNGS